MYFIPKIYNKFLHELNIIKYLPWSLVFNFHYLPFKQAIKLPIIFNCIPNFEKLSGKVIISSVDIFRGMIVLGKTIAPIYKKRSFVFQNSGIIEFQGKGFISDNSYLSCNEGSTVVFGPNFSFNCGSRIISSCGIQFGSNILVSWDCTFIDTDFHPLYDLISGRVCKHEKKIIIGDRCWIGHNTIISKGVKIPNESTVSSGSVVKGIFKEPNALIGGNPASLIDEGFMCYDMFLSL